MHQVDLKRFAFTFISAWIFGTILYVTFSGAEIKLTPQGVILEEHAWWGLSKTQAQIKHFQHRDYDRPQWMVETSSGAVIPLSGLSSANNWDLFFYGQP